MNTKKIILSTEKLFKRFDKDSSAIDTSFYVLNNLSLEFYQEDFTVIMGSSGAGKSTLLYALSGLDSVTSGKVFYKERNITTVPEKEIIRLRRKEFGFVFQQNHLVSNLTLLENVAVSGFFAGIKNSTNLAKELLEQIGLSKVMDNLPGQVSGGEAQRCAVARAVMGNPQILFADEPTGALNKKNTEIILDLLSYFNSQGQSIIMVTHDIRTALRGNRILYLEDGSILSQLILPPYDGKEDLKVRETQITDWLLSLSW